MVRHIAVQFPQGYIGYRGIIKPILLWKLYWISLYLLGCAIVPLGPPEAVTDLRVAECVSHMVATWEAPFTLDVTGVEYDVTYSLLISNITDDTQPTPVDCAVCRNLTLPQYVFSPPNPLPGHTFTFIVTPQNGAGTGPPSLPITVTPTDGMSRSSQLSSRDTASHPEDCTLLL